MFGRILCILGWHRYEQKTVTEGNTITDYIRCRDPHCSAHRQWVVEYQGRRPW